MSKIWQGNHSDEKEGDENEDTEMNVKYFSTIKYFQQLFIPEQKHVLQCVVFLFKKCSLCRDSAVMNDSNVYRTEKLRQIKPKSRRNLRRGIKGPALLW